jgi:hypothetical protein
MFIRCEIASNGGLETDETSHMTTSDSLHRMLFPIATAALCWALLGGPVAAENRAKIPVAADDDPDVEEVGIVPKVLPPGVRYATEAFDQLVFGGPGADAIAAAQVRLDSTLREKIKLMDRVCGLTEIQKQKLHLAGNGDISRFLHRATEKRKAFEFARNDNAAVRNELRHETSALNDVIARGLFRAGSLFDKTAKRTVSGGQLAQYEALREVELAGGYVAVRLQGRDEVIDVRLTASSFDGSGLARIRDLTNLQRLDLNGTAVSDASLLHVQGLVGLKVIDLCDTKVSDAGLAHLAGLKSLEVLYLVNTPVTDAGILHITKLESLRAIYLTGTKVSDAGLATLKQALPGLVIRN